MFPKVVATAESLAVLCRNSKKKGNFVKTIIFSNIFSDLTKKMIGVNLFAREIRFDNKTRQVTTFICNCKEF